MNHKELKFESVVDRIQHEYDIIRVSNIVKRPNVCIYQGKISNDDPSFASKHVAVKIQAEENDPLRDILTQEARIYSYLRHKNIVRIEFTTSISLTQNDSYRCLVMEYVDGLDLKEVLSQVSLMRKKIPASVVFTIIREVLEGIIYIHNCKDDNGNNLNIVHRDISLENIMISHNGEVKILDFGIALLGNEKTSKIAGKPDYMSPEQISGKNIDQRSDIYAIGLVLLELIASHRVKKNNRSKILDSNVFDKEIKKIIIKSISENPQDRYQNGDEFLKDIEEYIDQKKIKIQSGELRKFMKDDLHDDSQTTIYEDHQDFYKKTTSISLSKKNKKGKRFLAYGIILISLTFYFYPNINSIFIQKEEEPLKPVKPIPQVIIPVIKKWKPNINIQSNNASIKLISSIGEWQDVGNLTMSLDELDEDEKLDYKVIINKKGYHSKSFKGSLSINQSSFDREVQLIKKEKGTVLFGADPWALISVGEYENQETPFKASIIEGKAKVIARYEDPTKGWIKLKKEVDVKPKNETHCVADFIQKVINCK